MGNEVARAALRPLRSSVVAFSQALWKVSGPR